MGTEFEPPATTALTLVPVDISTKSLTTMLNVTELLSAAFELSTILMVTILVVFACARVGVQWNAPLLELMVWCGWKSERTRLAPHRVRGISLQPRLPNKTSLRRCACSS